MNSLIKGGAPSVCFVSTYPPTECGLATFSFSLRSAMAELRGTGDGLAVVSLIDGVSRSSTDGRVAGSELVYEHANGDRDSLGHTIDVLNRFDLALFEHEYGIYGGPDGSEIIEMVSGLRIPSAVTLHTIPTDPTVAQRSILERLVAETDQTIVMTNAAARRLGSHYQIEPEKLRVIPHGASPALVRNGTASDRERPVILTWGLIGPGKGLERAIRSFVGLRDLSPAPRYVILGRTHPKVRAANGDAYLNSLKRLVNELHLEDIVEFDGRYMDVDSLTKTIRGVDMILIPYDSKEQATSGVLVEAIAAGKPVVATAFPHAIEALETGAGIVVAHDDPNEMTAALRSLLTNSEMATQMAETARRVGSELLWPRIAASYEEMIGSLVADAEDQRVARVS